jgi:hypothetical protein
VISLLELAQESRVLSSDELEVISLLKKRLLGLATIERSMARQRSRLTWIKKGDVNMKYFQIMANNRKQKNYIAALSNGAEVITSHHEKHHLIFNHYQSHIGAYSQRSRLLNFSELQWQPQDLRHLDIPFSKQEVSAVINSMPKQKALGPDGFIGAF